MHVLGIKFESRQGAPSETDTKKKHLKFLIHFKMSHFTECISWDFDLDLKPTETKFLGSKFKI